MILLAASVVTIELRNYFKILLAKAIVAADAWPSHTGADAAAATS